MWALRRYMLRLAGQSCNGRGQMWACDGKEPCYCDAVVGAESDDNGRNPLWGIIHVPHIDDAEVNFNKSLAGFLATAGGSGTRGACSTGAGCSAASSRKSHRQRGGGE